MINISVSSFIIAIPEIYLVLVAFILLIFGMFYNKKDNNSSIILFNKFSIISIISMFLTLGLIYSVGDAFVETFNGTFIISPVIYLFKVVIIVLVILISIVSKKYLIDIGIYSYEYIVIQLFMLAGILAMLSSNDFLSFYIAFELVTICTYILIFLERKSLGANEAGLKYFILGSLGTGFLLYGISLLYGFTGHTSFIEIKQYLAHHNSNLILLISLVTILVGIGFKLSLVPFHMWTIDVYKGSNMSTTLMLATVLKAAVFFMLVRILWEPLQPLYFSWKPVVELIIIMTTATGFILAIMQTNIKSFVAYSSIANMGYMLMGILVIDSSSIENIVIYSLTYFISLIGFVGILMMLQKDKKPLENIYDLKGLSRTNPILTFALSTFLISMAGIPVAAGFFGKIFILLSVISDQQYVLATIVILLSVVIMYYYFKIIKIMYFDVDHEALPNFSCLQGYLDIKITLSLIFIFVIGFILFVGPLLNLIKQFAVVL